MKIRHPNGPHRVALRGAGPAIPTPEDILRMPLAVYIKQRIRLLRFADNCHEDWLKRLDTEPLSSGFIDRTYEDYTTRVPETRSLEELEDALAIQELALMSSEYMATYDDDYLYSSALSKAVQRHAKALGGKK